MLRRCVAGLSTARPGGSTSTVTDLNDVAVTVLQLKKGACLELFAINLASADRTRFLSVEKCQAFRGATLRDGFVWQEQDPATDTRSLATVHGSHASTVPAKTSNSWSSPTFRTADLAANTRSSRWSCSERRWRISACAASQGHAGWRCCVMRLCAVRSSPPPPADGGSAPFRERDPRGGHGTRIDAR